MAASPAGVDVRADGRGRRLVTVLVIGLVLVGAYVGWRVASSRALDDRTPDAVRELRRGWRTVDLAALADQVLVPEQGFGSGPAVDAGRRFPETDDARWVGGSRRADDVVVSRYEVKALGRLRCLTVRAEGPVPNEVRFAQHDGRC